MAGAVCHLRKASDGLQSGRLAMISERGVVYRTKRMGPQVLSPEAHHS